MTTPLKSRRRSLRGIGKLTAKGQTTVPREIRAALGAASGDLLVWEIEEDGIARVRRLQPIDLEYLRAVEATLTEWGGPEDEAAYRDL